MEKMLLAQALAFKTVGTTLRLLSHSTMLAMCIHGEFDSWPPPTR